MPGVLLIISGPSGVGKSTICQRLVTRLDAFLSVSATTRRRRENEVDGQDYHFVSLGQFEQGIEQGRFLEYAKAYGGQYYGTPAGPVLEALNTGRVVILEIEIDGTLQVMRRFPDAVSVYVMAPTLEEQQDRLAGRRKTSAEAAEAIKERLSKADGEIRWAHECGAYRHFVVNADIEESVNAIVKIVEEKRAT